MDESLKKLIKLVPNVKYRIDNDKCTLLDFTSPYNAFHGLIRHYSISDKKQILNLISKFKDLKYLDLRKNRLMNLDLDLENLEYLDLGSNYIGVFPNFILNCKNLKYLNLGVNELKTIPEINLNLRTFKVHKNHLKEIPFFRARYINLYLNNLREIPLFLENMDVKLFSWGGNSLKSLDRIVNWKNCIWLSVVATKIEEIPEEVCNFENLMGLRLPKNKIKFIPKNIGNLRSLNHFSVYGNQIEHIPESFNKLNLTKLNLSGNKIKDFSSINYKNLIWYSL